MKSRRQARVSKREPPLKVLCGPFRARATVEKRSAEGTEITGAGGQAAVAMAKLLAKAREIAENSTAPEAKDFDAAKWLGRWIERPQPALGGRKPADLIGTPTGVEMVSRLLGAIESGAYL